MAVLQFKFDESYDNRVMSVGGWIGDELEWKRLESTWQRRIDFENSHNRDDQQITRFHASHMNCKDGEFENWDKDMCLKFSKKLIHLLSKRRMGSISIACDMDAIREVFPNGDFEGMIRRTYVLCFKVLMIEIARVLREYFLGDHVLLIHDHGNWDVQALEAYNLVIDEPAWEPRLLFEGLLPRTGSQDVGLQAADMIAYEVFKGIRARTKSPEAAMRGAVQEMRNKEIAMITKWIDLPAANALFRYMKESGKYPDLELKGVT